MMDSENEATPISLANNAKENEAMEEKSVLILTQHFPPELIGGVETRFEAMAHAAAATGRRVLVVVTHASKSAEGKSKGVLIRWLDGKLDVTFHPARLDRLLAQALQNENIPTVAWVANPSLANSLKRLWPSVPVVLMPGQVGSLSWRSSVQRMMVSCRRHGFRLAIRSLLRDFAFRKAIRNVEIVAIPCRYQRKSLCANSAWIAEKTHVLSRGICVDRWRSSRRKRSFDSLRPLRLLVACRLDPVKNLALAIRASALVVRQGIALQLRIVGSGEEESSLRTLVDSLNLNDAVEFLPMSHDMEMHYQWADAFIMCSNNELFGNTVLEALAAGCPVLLRKNDPPHIVLGCWEQLDKCPCVIPFATNGDSGLANAMASLATEFGKLERLSREAEIYSEDLDWTKFVNEYVAISKHECQSQTAPIRLRT